MEKEPYLELKLIYPQLVEENDYGIAVAELSDWGFDMFSEQEHTLSGYIRPADFEIHRTRIEAFIRSLESQEIRVEWNRIEPRNWNAVWESGFEPIDVEGRVCVRAEFHQAGSCPLDIVIQPKMSFGTGHHQTTWLMMKQMLDCDLSGKSGLDMGTGTGVLAILALKCGASRMTAIDIDQWAYENARENAAVNGVEQQMEVMLGDATLLHGVHYDFILANINRNVLLGDLSVYARHLSPGGFVLLSGFLKADEKVLREKAHDCGLTVRASLEKEGWLLLHCIK